MARIVSSNATIHWTGPATDVKEDIDKLALRLRNQIVTPRNTDAGIFTQTRQDWFETHPRWFEAEHPEPLEQETFFDQ